MSAEVIALLVLVLVFVVASVRSVNMGALALVAAAVVGATVYDVGPAEVLSGFPGNLFVILVGVTYLFAIVKNNGTVDWLAISSSMVDCSPFSTNGALVVANAEEKDREMVFKRLMQWGMSIVIVAPVLSWALLVLPGWA